MSAGALQLTYTGDVRGDATTAPNAMSARCPRNNAGFVFKAKKQNFHLENLKSKGSKRKLV